MDYSGILSTNYSKEFTKFPIVLSCSNEWEENKAVKVLDGLFDTYWDAGHLSGWDVPNWIIFDFGQEVRLSEFSFRSSGDCLHDVNDFSLETSNAGNKPWKIVESMKGKKSYSNDQSFIINSVSRYFRFFIKTRYSRFQAYIHSCRFKISTNLGRNSRLSSVEKEFLRLSQRSDNYPNEKIAVIETSNVAVLGQLTALSFLEWVQENPKGVVALPTGKTPEHFIKWLLYYKSSWGTLKTMKEITNFDVKIKNETFPPTEDLIFCQLDEFFPISKTNAHSFLNYVRKYYVRTLELKEENLNLIDYSTFKIFKENSMDYVFPNGKCDLELRTREPKTELEVLQKKAILEADEFCIRYEVNIQKLGGIGFFLGGIGYDGHIAFNFSGCDPQKPTRLVTLNYQTAAQCATDFGGIEYTRNKNAITIGLSTITKNPKAKIIIMAAGEAKGKVVRDAIMSVKHRSRPASYLQNIPGARFYLTEGSSLFLKDRRIEDIQKKCKYGTLSEKDLINAICDLSLLQSKKILELTAKDFLQYEKTKHIYVYWVKQSFSITMLKEKAVLFLIESLNRGLSLPAGQRILHTSPHHDDIMLAYHEITNFLFQYNRNYIIYITSGFNSVSDSYVKSVLERLSWIDKKSLEKVFKPFIECKLETVLIKFKEAYFKYSNSEMQNIETILVLRRLKQVWDCKTFESLQIQVEYLLRDYFPQKYLGQMDSEDVKLFKGSIRESECDRMWAIQDVPHQNVFHTRSKFYTGDFFNPMPTINEDAKPMLSLYEQINPDIITVAFDPEGTGPDTHYKVLQIVAQGLRLAKEKKLSISAKIWGYRNVWHRFCFAATNIAIPISVSSMNEMHRTFLASFSCQRKAEFPSPEYDGPFSILSQKYHRKQLIELKTMLGKDFFMKHLHPNVKNADGIILLKEMDLSSFLKSCEDLQSKIELGNLLN